MITIINRATIRATIAIDPILMLKLLTMVLAMGVLLRLCPVQGVHGPNDY